MNKFITSALFSALAFQAVADTTDHKWITIIELEKQGEHCAMIPIALTGITPKSPRKRQLISEISWFTTPVMRSTQNLL